MQGSVEFFQAPPETDEQIRPVTCYRLVWEADVSDRSTQAVANAAGTTPHLRRVLTLWDLIFYGIVLIMPIAPVPMFGIAQKLSHGHFVTTILLVLLC